MIKRIIVQAKRYKNNVGIKSVQEIVSAKEFYKADETWVVTNSEFIVAAYKLAKVNRVVLINREKLIKLISQGKREKEKLVIQKVRYRLMEKAL